MRKIFSYSRPVHAMRWIIQNIKTDIEEYKGLDEIFDQKNCNLIRNIKIRNNHPFMELSDDEILDLLEEVALTK